MRVQLGAAREGLSGLPDGRGLNIAYEAVDRHLLGESRDAVALRCLGRRGEVEDITYAELSRRTNRFANLLVGLGVQRGERVFALLPRRADLYVTVLGTLKRGAVLSPLFAAFGPEPIRERMTRGDAAVLVTTPEMYVRKIAPMRAALPSLRHVLVTGERTPPAGTSSLAEGLVAAGEDFEIPPTAPQDMALVHFTSGTTGKPKGAVHVHEAVVAHHATAAFALDLRAGDVFWCTADPGWVTGTSYGIIAPLTHGATVIVDGGLRGQALVSDPGGAAGDRLVHGAHRAPHADAARRRTGRQVRLSALRFVASVGEPLNPEVVVWGKEALGRPVHDNWWQTETGAIMISNFAGEEIRPGSMGRPMPGVDVALLEHGPDGRALIVDGAVCTIDEPDRVGELALRSGWPSMFRGHLHDPRRYARCFAGGWYLSGDLASRDADGYYWFVGRGDDVIKSAGHLIGPFEVESALMEHPAVAEAGVIGKPDPVAGEVVKAFVTLRPDFEPSDDLRLELLGFGRRQLGAVAPKEIAFDQHLPHTRSGKVMRRLLKARELNLPTGDLSTLESLP